MGFPALARLATSRSGLANVENAPLDLTGTATSAVISRPAHKAVLSAHSTISAYQ